MSGTSDLLLLVNGDMSKTLDELIKEETLKINSGTIPLNEDSVGNKYEAIYSLENPPLQSIEKYTLTPVASSTLIFPLVYRGGGATKLISIGAKGIATVDFDNNSFFYETQPTDLTNAPGFSGYCISPANEIQLYVINDSGMIFRIYWAGTQWIKFATSYQVTETGSWNIIADETNVYCGSGHYIHKLNLDLGLVLKSAYLANNGMQQISESGDYIFALGADRVIRKVQKSNLTVVASSTAYVGSNSVGITVRQILCDDEFVYVATGNNNRVLKYDQATLSLVASSEQMTELVNTIKIFFTADKQNIIAGGNSIDVPAKILNTDTLEVSENYPFGLGKTFHSNGYFYADDVSGDSYFVRGTTLMFKTTTEEKYIKSYRRV